MPSATGLPDLVVVGAQKCGTSWLRHNLDAHPDIFMAVGEPGFFNDDKRFRRGAPSEADLDEYRGRFAPHGRASILGDRSTGYLMLRHDPSVVAERIDGLLPGVRVVAILRNPVDRAESALLHQIRRGRLPVGSRLVDVVREHPPTGFDYGIVTGGLYGESLEPYVARFGDRLLVVFHDDLTDDPESLYRRVVAHAGADPSFVPADVGTVRFSSRQGREPLRQRLGRRWRGLPARGDVLAGHTSLEAADRAEMWSYFADDVARLERLVDRDLRRWAPAGADR